MNSFALSRSGFSSLRIAALVLLVASVSRASTVYSWETGLDGWSADTVNGYSITTASTLGVTDGASALQLTAPSSGMWWSAGFSRNLGGTELGQIFTGATQLGLDVTYNPGSDTWYLDANVALIVQGEKQSWTELAGVTIPKGTSPTAATWSISSTVASNMATSSWGQILLKLTYGNGGSAPSVFYVDDFTTNASAIPEPSSCALVLGLVAIGGAAMRRRRRA